MSDLIDRQALLKVLEERKKPNNGGEDGTKERYRYMQWLTDYNAVKEAPSAQMEIVRCKDCRYRIINSHYGERGYLKIKAYCELDTGDPFELARYAENDDWFCADAERRTDE